MGRLIGTFLAGLIAVLPLSLTVVVLAWLISFLNQYIGPSSVFGAFLVSLGLGPGTHKVVSYVIGIVAILACIFVLGLLVESRLGRWLVGFFEGLISKIPGVSYLYDVSRRVVSMVDGRSGQGIQDMKPVWCFFGGKPGAAVLALLPTTKSVELGSERYLAVLIPSAPVPFGGALIYVPESWIEPAKERVDDLVSVYVSMGLQVPNQLTDAVSESGAAPLVGAPPISPTK